MTNKPNKNVEFKDSNISKSFQAFKEFYMNHEVRKMSGSEFVNLKNLKKVIANIEQKDLTWSLICSLAKNEDVGFHDKLRMIRMTIKFSLFVSECKLLSIKEKDLFLLNKEAISNFVSHVSIGYSDLLDENLTSPNSIYSWNHLNEYVVGLIQTKNNFLLFVFKQFLIETPLQDQFKIKRCIEFFSYFEQSISPLVISNYEDFNDRVFFRCLKNVDRHFGEGNRNFVSTRVISFFQWLLNYMPKEVREKNFVLVDSVLLTYIHLIGKIMDGYIVTKYSPYDSVKYFEKMILIPSSDEFHNKGESYRVYPFEVSNFNNHTLKKWYTEYFWKCKNSTLKLRTKVFYPLKSFLEDYDKTIDEDFTKIEFNESDVARYVSICKSKNNGDANTARMISQLKMFLKFLELEKLSKVKPILYRMLVYKDSNSEVRKEAYTASEINRIISHLRKDKPLHALAIAIVANSELRANSVLNLKTDCLIKTLTRADGEEYAVKAHTKRSDNSVELVNINKYVKTYIDECIEYTKTVREKMNSYDKDYIFIHLQNGRVLPRRFKSEALANEINKACVNLNIKPNGTKGIRNNYMQAISNYVTENKLNPSIVSSLSGHTLQRHSKNYDQVDIVKFCEQHYSINIGNVQIRGEVKESANYTKENTVASNCGFCKEKHCNLNGFLDCFMCKSFVTTISCIPFYEVEIKNIENKIIKENISHERDFLLSKKKLLVGYLSQLMILKGDLE